MHEPDGLLLLPRLRVQNANAISGPLTWGFPSPTAFLGFAHALQRKLQEKWDLRFTGTGIVCHWFDPQTSYPAGRHHQVFNLSRNPIRAGYKKYEDKDAALVEEGRAHMEISLLLETEGDMDDEPTDFLQDMLETVHGMRLAGGSLIPAHGEAHRPHWQPWWDDEEDNRTAFRELRHRLLPGFALVQRPDLLEQRLAELRDETPEANTLDALLDLCALHIEPESDDRGATKWRYRRASGWIVPLPVGYGALSETLEPGEVGNARDSQTPFRFVESLYSLGQWLSPHRIGDPGNLMWRQYSDEDNGLYLCANDYTTTFNDKE
ncbi:MAG TPA: type I-F CRISPR-associated protein Csy2 [Gammaproteobacteria bacterium]|nr:type I-F CRISPR-associated protein Csy2 [Gammaproteobacteria bacterium]